MRPPSPALREGAALIVLAALVAAVVITALAASAVIGGGPGLLAGLVAGLGTAQLLRRPAGTVMGRFIDA